MSSFPSLQRKLRAVNGSLGARLAATNGSNEMSTLISILCRLAQDYQKFSDTSFRRNAPQNKKPRLSPSSPLTEAVLECINTLAALSRDQGIRSVASSVSQHSVFGSTRAVTEDPIEAARMLRYHESSQTQQTRTYPVTLHLLQWFERCVKLLVYQRTVVDLKDKFNHFDEDGDGSITRIEFLNKLQQPPFTRKLSAATLRQLIAQFDQDGDDEVDFAEFVAFYFAQQNNQLPGGGSGGTVENISEEEARAANDVAVEMHHVFTQLTGRGPAAIASENTLLYKVTSFVVETFVELANWRFDNETERHTLSEACLRIMHWILRYGNLGSTSLTKQGSTQSSGGHHAPAAHDARDLLLEAILEDRNLQHRLMSSVTSIVRLYPTITKVVVNSDRTAEIHYDERDTELWIAQGSSVSIHGMSKSSHLNRRFDVHPASPNRRASSGVVRIVVPVLDPPIATGDYDKPLGTGLSYVSSTVIDDTGASDMSGESVAMLGMAEQACEVLLDILISDDAESPSERTELAKSKLKLIALRDDALPGRNSIVTLGSYIPMLTCLARGSGRATGCRLQRLSMKIMEELTSILSVVSASFQQSAVGSDRATMLRRLKSQGSGKRGGVRNAANGNNLTGGVDRLLSDATLSTSLLSFYSDEEKIQLRHHLYQVFQQLGRDDQELQELQRSTLAFVTACCHNQPNFGSFLLDAVEVASGNNTSMLAHLILNSTQYYHEAPSVLASAYGLISVIWDQGFEKKKRFLRGFGDPQQEGEFWKAVAKPLLETVPLEYPQQQPTRPEIMAKYSSQMEVCSFSLRLIASKLMVHYKKRQDDPLIEDLKRKLCSVPNGDPNGPKLLDIWFRSFCTFDTPSRELATSSKSALEMGVNLALFEKLPVPLPGSRTYSDNYIYDTKLLGKVLNQNFKRSGEATYKEERRNCLISLSQTNAKLGAADAQLFAIQSLKKFMEVYCMIPMAEEESGGGGAGAGNNTKHILTSNVLDVFRSLSSKSSTSSIVLQELTQLFLILLHKKMFPRTSPLAQRDVVALATTQTTQTTQTFLAFDMSMIQTIMMIMEAWCNRVFGSSGSDETGVDGLASGSVFGNLTVGGGSYSAKQSWSGEAFEMETVRPLLGSSVLILHAMVELQKRQMVELQKRDETTKLDPELELLMKRVRVVVLRACACVEYVGSILARHESEDSVTSDTLM